MVENIYRVNARVTPFSGFIVGDIIVFTLCTIHAFVHDMTRGVYVRDLRLRKVILCRRFCHFSAGLRVRFSCKNKEPNPRHPESTIVPYMVR